MKCFSFVGDHLSIRRRSFPVASSSVLCPLTPYESTSTTYAFPINGNCFDDHHSTNRVSGNHFVSDHVSGNQFVSDHVSVDHPFGNQPSGNHPLSISLGGSLIKTESSRDNDQNQAAVATEGVNRRGSRSNIANCRAIVGRNRSRENVENGDSHSAVTRPPVAKRMLFGRSLQILVFGLILSTGCPSLSQAAFRKEERQPFPRLEDDDTDQIKRTNALREFLAALMRDPEAEESQRREALVGSAYSDLDGDVGNVGNLGNAERGDRKSDLLSRLRRRLNKRAGSDDAPMVAMEELAVLCRHNPITCFGRRRRKRSLHSKVGKGTGNQPKSGYTLEMKTNNL